ncbi:hypothetical protein TRAPUB_2943 [Trametes pubescens]|uniref:CCHC-type domain-containing protein n=1 Tax=Trametes pubescens TaxID=154538 RepID=A0A1M2VF95_TRAPU|nr:hypothetical protein TRAPUB_2943 [Trametes pubescens]
MSSTNSPSLSDFIAGVEKLDSMGSNWLISEQQFTIAVKQKEVWGHFDGTTVRPTQAGDTATPAETTTITAWEKKENFTLYLLTLKIVPATYAKHKRKGDTAKIWKAITQEFTSKSLLARSNLRRDFLNMRADPSQDLRSEIDRLQLTYENLLMYDVAISSTEYASVIINFLPDTLSAFILQLSAQMKLQARLTPATPSSDSSTALDTPAIEPDLMIELVLEEWERRRDDKKGKKSKDTGITASAVSTEKPKWKGKGRGPQRPVGVCWNCGGKGHHEVDCPSPKSDSSKGKGAPKGQGRSNNSMLERVLSARIKEVPIIRGPGYEGVWSAMLRGPLTADSGTDEDIWSSAGDSAYSELTEATDSDSPPSLQTVSGSMSSCSEDDVAAAQDDVEPSPPPPEHVPLLERM